MCEPNGSDLAGHGSHEIVLKLNAPINSQTVGNKELVETFFDLDGATYEHACRYEDCKKKNKKVLANTSKHGYANLLSHLRNHHPDYMDDYTHRLQPGRRNALLQFVTVKKSEAENLLGWFTLVLEKNMPLNFIDDPDWRRHLKLEAISSKYFKSVGFRLVRVVERIIGTDLLKCHGVWLAFDGWGKRIDGSSYFAIIGVSDFGVDASGNRLSPLLHLF